MKVCGFTFIRNAIKFDYPVEESIRSILPICDEIVVAVGNSEDGTRSLVEAISPKIKIMDSVWDEGLRSGGRVLAVETNKALKEISKDADWCIYLQGDEVIHEKYHPVIQSAMLEEMDDDKVDGLLLKFLHFYGSYRLVANATQWYRREIRIIKNNRNIYSYRDAQGFRKEDDCKLWVREIDAWVYHYGWAKHPVKMQAKQGFFQKLWHSDQQVMKKVAQKKAFDYSTIDSLLPFKGSHPAVMAERVAQQNWDFDYDVHSNNLSLKEKIKLYCEKKFDWIPGEYRNYIKVK